MSNCHGKANGNVLMFTRVVVFLELITFASACNFTYDPITTMFEENISKLKEIMFKDYEVEVIENFDTDNIYCLEIWKLYNIHTMLKNKTAVAVADSGLLRCHLEIVLNETKFIEKCLFVVPDTCKRHKKLIVDVLNMENETLQNLQGSIKNKDYQRCLNITCVSDTFPGRQGDKDSIHHENLTRNRLSDFLLLLLVPVAILIGIAFVVYNRNCRVPEETQGQQV
ncbi:fms-related tyrosine kinase 3 ligand [Hyperolius riggenbachi]|uniref:fms-related tyrosine kinase 3 ligand n=1 Tax=Hyperolius riggenbachi TaxID=752182 RepID=UPI0035A2F114